MCEIEILHCIEWAAGPAEMKSFCPKF